ncbi:hypothetical protein BDV95DRAFT_393077 [Massariosphaeria phaeospora]|uniref:Uncharacterized protein n=2 Tax=Massariosphaeria phaeospora TaxID=100035 RepID=A0A7C8IB37_9PLEO|nr:hypothetical protein BDV95DRAFT_393077 [Massariosphaeria phaeospora]
MTEFLTSIREYCEFLSPKASCTSRANHVYRLLSLTGEIDVGGKSSGHDLRLCFEQTCTTILQLHNAHSNSKSRYRTIMAYQSDTGNAYSSDQGYGYGQGYGFSTSTQPRYQEGNAENGMARASNYTGRLSDHKYGQFQSSYTPQLHSADYMSRSPNQHSVNKSTDCYYEGGSDSDSDYISQPQTQSGRSDYIENEHENNISDDPAQKSRSAQSRPDMSTTTAYTSPRNQNTQSGYSREPPPDSASSQSHDGSRWDNKSDYRVMEDCWGGRKRSVESHGLRLGNTEDFDEARELLDAYRRVDAQQAEASASLGSARSSYPRDQGWRQDGHREEDCQQNSYQPNSYQPNSYQPNSYQPNSYQQNNHREQNHHRHQQTPYPQPKNQQPTVHDDDDEDVNSSQPITPSATHRTASMHQSPVQQPLIQQRSASPAPFFSGFSVLDNGDAGQQRELREDFNDDDDDDDEDGYVDCGAEEYCDGGEDDGDGGGCEEDGDGGGCEEDGDEDGGDDYCDDGCGYGEY